MEHHEDHPPVQLVEELGVLHHPFGHQRVGELDPEGARHAAMRYSGSPSANFLTMRYASKLAEAMLFGIGGSAGTCARATARGSGHRNISGAASRVLRV